jgi:hypothetical protein
MLVAVVVTVGILELILDYRGVGLREALAESRRIGDEDPDAEALVRVDDNLLRLAQVTAVIPKEHPYATWRYFLWVAVRPVPRVLWPAKPTDPGFDLAQHLGMRGVSLSMSVVGELFMAGGFFMVLFGGWLYGRVAGVLCWFFRRDRPPGYLIVYCAGLFALFVGVRSMIELVLMSYAIGAWFALSWCQGRIWAFSHGPSATQRKHVLR